MMSIADRRDYFPRGLEQPESGFRFSTDPLLLACFMKTRSGDRVLDLGTGCGVVGLGMALQNPGIDLRGVDVDPAMVDAARSNATLLGLDRTCFFHEDLAGIRVSGTIPPESFDMVVANPPYRDPGSGRICPESGRAPARFETRGTVRDFVAAAAYAVKNRGRVGMVFLAERLDYLLQLLREYRLTPKRVLPVHSRGGESARLVLVEARKNGGDGMVLASGLSLYCGTGDNTVLTDEAVLFCPFLGCNTKK